VGELLKALQGRRVGLSIKTLSENVGASRWTVRRYLGLLEEAGFQIAKEERNGGFQYRLLGDPMPAVDPTARQTEALQLAQQMLAPLKGTRVLREFDALVPKKRKATVPAPLVEVGPPAAVGEPLIASVVEHAIRSGRRLSFIYAATGGAPSLRKVDPLMLHMRDGQLYLNAFDVERAKLRTFKLARVSSPEMLDEKAQPHDECDKARVLPHAAKIWDAPAVDIVVRISPSVARFVKEWPLIASQQIEAQPDGSAIVRAQVAGTVEAMRWVLRWGKGAIVLEPPELRAAVLEELRQALAAYQEEGDSVVGSPRQRLQETP
jgi:predicted DNA-binding transcriptional regulator YafY